MRVVAAKRIVLSPAHAGNILPQGLTFREALVVSLPGILRLNIFSAISLINVTLLNRARRLHESYVRIRQRVPLAQHILASLLILGMNCQLVTVKLLEISHSLLRINNVDWRMLLVWLASPVHLGCPQRPLIQHMVLQRF